MFDASSVVWGFKKIVNNLYFLIANYILSSAWPQDEKLLLVSFPSYKVTHYCIGSQTKVLQPFDYYLSILPTVFFNFIKWHLHAILSLYHVTQIMLGFMCLSFSGLAELCCDIWQRFEIDCLKFERSCTFEQPAVFRKYFISLDIKEVI